MNAPAIARMISECVTIGAARRFLFGKASLTGLHRKHGISFARRIEVPLKRRLTEERQALTYDQSARIYVAILLPLRCDLQSLQLIVSSEIYLHPPEAADIRRSKQFQIRYMITVAIALASMTSVMLYSEPLKCRTLMSEPIAPKPI